MLAELAVTGRIRVELAEPDGRRRFHPYDDSMTVTDPTPYGDPEADAVLADIKQRPRRLVYLVELAADEKCQRSQDGSTLRTRLLSRLVQEGTLRVNHTKTLGIFPGNYYPIVDDSAATDALARLDRVLHGEIPDVRTGALAILLAPPGVKVTGFGLAAFPGTSMRRRRDLFYQLRDGDWCDTALLETLTAIVAACLDF